MAEQGTGMVAGPAPQEQHACPSQLGGSGARVPGQVLHRPHRLQPDSLLFSLEGFAPFGEAVLLSWWLPGS